MRYLALLVLLVGCEHHVAEAEADPVDSFQPTAFTVQVSGHGRPVILIPGLASPGAVWDGTVAHLATTGHETHVLTLAGFAGQPRIAGPLAAATREELAHYIRAHALDHPVIIGHSMGGMIAYWLAETDPDLVGPTIVVDAGAALTDGPSAGAGARAMWANADDATYTQQIHDVFGSMTAKPERLAPLLPAMAASDRTALGDAIAEQFAVDLRPELAHIHAPVLLVLADGGLAAGLREQTAPIPDRTVVVVPGAKHFVMIDAPDELDRAIDGFLAAHR